MRKMIEVCIPETKRDGGVLREVCAVSVGLLL